MHCVKKLVKIFKYVLGIMFAFITSYLLLLSMFGTSMQQEVNDGSLYNYFLDDQSWKHFLCFAIVILIFLLVSVKVSDEKILVIYKCVKPAVIILTLVLGFVFIYKTQLFPVSDSYKIYRIVDQLMNGIKTGFDPSGYMYRYPDQSGYLLYYMIMIVLFHNSAFIVMQIVNLLFEVMIIWTIMKITELIWNNDRISLLSALIISAFYPLFLHITYLYGIIPGLCLSLISVYFSCRGLKENKIRYYIATAIGIGLAVQFKTNSIIWFIGIFIIMLLSVIKRIVGDRTGVKACVLGLLLMIISVFAFSKGVVATIENTCGVTISKGMPKTTWIEMGLKDSESTPGSYNGYSVGLFEKYNYDYEATNKQAIIDIKMTLNNMIKNPRGTVSQFVRKIAWLWNNPTFQCLETLKYRESAVNIMEQKNGWFNSLLYGKLRYIFIDLFNYVQTLILGGAVLFILLKRKIEYKELMSMIIVIGGFVFHIFWESKPQYVLPYFVLFIPLAAEGYVNLVDRIKITIVQVKENKILLNKKAWNKVVRYIVLVIILVLLCTSPELGKIVNVRSDDSRCEEYLEKKTEDIVKYR